MSEYQYYEFLAIDRPLSAKDMNCAASRAQFEAALQRFMAPHTRRSALVRRLVEAGLWKKI